MKKNLQSKQVVITDCNQTDNDFWKLYHIFRLTICPGMSYKLFEAYYKSQRLEYISVCFFYSAEEELIGFCAAAFYTTETKGKRAAIARSATGFIQEYQGKALSKWSLYSKYMLYKMHHPFKPLTLTIYASNPFIYSMVCKYTGIVYPRVGKPVPEKIVQLKNELLASANLQKREVAPFVVRINFEVEKSEDFKINAIASSNIHVKFFLSQTGLRNCVTLLLIIPVSFTNIACCIWLMAKYTIIKKIAGSKKTSKKLLSKHTYLPNALSKFLTISKTHYANRKGM